jgi:hypothetical protein
MFALLSLGFLTGAVSVRSQATNASESEVHLCDIQSNPSNFLNGTFEVRAIYFAGFESGWLKDVESCEIAQVPKAIRYLFDEGFKKNTDKALYKRFERKLKPSPGGALPRAVRGVFRIRIELYEKANEMDKRFEFQIKVLSAVAIK